MKLFFRYFFRTIRIILGPIVLFADKITTPKGLKRPEKEQQSIDVSTENLKLYQFKTCPFCIKVRRTNKRLTLNIKTRDAQKNQQHREQLLDGGGKIKVPCLRITDQEGNHTWMYDSESIIGYLNKNYAPANSNA